jgi:hypothetical protein
MSKLKTNQKGGMVLGPIMMIVNFVLRIVENIFKVVFKVTIFSFKVTPPMDPTTPWYKFSEYDWGPGWILLYYLSKAMMYLIIFVLGGPVAVIIGIIYMYMKLYKSLNVCT